MSEILALEAAAAEGKLPVTTQQSLTPKAEKPAPKSNNQDMTNFYARRQAVQDKNEAKQKALEAHDRYEDKLAASTVATTSAESTQLDKNAEEERLKSKRTAQQ